MLVSATFQQRLCCDRPVVSSRDHDPRRSISSACPSLSERRVRFERSTVDTSGSMSST